MADRCLRRVGLVAAGCLVLVAAGCRKTATSGAYSGDLSRLSSDDQQLEGKIQPVIECLNRTLTHFDDLQPAYRAKLKEISGAKPPVSATGMPMIPPLGSMTFVSFKVEPYENGGEFSRTCADGLDKAAGMSPANAAIDGPAKDAAGALRDLLGPGAQMDAYLTQKAYMDDGGAKGRQLDASISPLLNRIVTDSHQLRSAVFDTKATLVQHELDAIEKKSGRNLDWHTRQTMQAASVANHQVQSAASSGQLDASGVTAAMAPLQAAMDDTQTFLNAHPEAARDTPGQVIPVWPSISGSLGGELAAMRELRASLASLSPVRSIVNGDLESVNRSYNGAVSNYNQMRGVAVAPR